MFNIGFIHAILLQNGNELHILKEATATRLEFTEVSVDALAFQCLETLTIQSDLIFGLY